MNVKLLAILTLLLILIPAASPAAARVNEKADYSKNWCEKIGGKLRVLVQNKTVVDCLTDQFAVKISFADEWASAIGYARYYAVTTGRDPGVALIVESPAQEFSLLVFLLTAIKDDSKNWRVWVVKPEDLAPDGEE